jgi:hypothetical protein
MMIPNTHWHDNNDGTAWVLLTELAQYCRANELPQLLDRPCDTCDGEGYEWDDDDDGSYDCPDCDCTGRHTFDVEVAWQTEVDAYESETYRVHVVPDMVLPIDGYDDDDRIAGKWRMWLAPGDVHTVDMPEAAEPGMWAVLLRILS